MEKVAFTTLGCRLNQAESDSMAEELATQGIEAAATGDSPDLVVINTCTVTREATKASRQAIRRAVKHNPGAKVVVIGCYAVSNPEEIEAIEGVDAILDNDDKENFLEALGTGLRSGPAHPARPTPLLQVGMRGSTKPSLPYRVRANLKAQTGCDEWCSFCIIPTTRGQLRSLEEDGLVRITTEPPRTDPATRTRRILRLSRELPSLTERDHAFGRARRQREAIG